MIEIIKAVGRISGMSIAIVLAIALLVFLFGLVKFVFRVGGDEAAVTDGKKLMTWGLVALFVMTSVWGIVKFMQSALNLPL